MGARHWSPARIVAGVANTRENYNVSMFVHLRLHSEFSVVDGTNRIDETVAAAAADGQSALAITDMGNLFGAIKFYKAARGAGIKPVIGAEILLEGLRPDPTAQSRLVLLVQNRTGYLHLCELLARAHTQNAGRNQPVLRWQWLTELAEGLIALSVRPCCKGIRRVPMASRWNWPRPFRTACTWSCNAPDVPTTHAM